MPYVIYFSLVIFSLAAIALNVLSLPGNWLMLAAAVVASAAGGWRNPGVWPLVVVFASLVMGELGELAAGMAGARKFGASRWAMWAAMLGGIVGAILGVPVPVVGNVLGAVLGSFLGALGCELVRERKMRASLWAALGAALGRTAGMMVKVICGLAAWGVLLWFAWPG